ncbi:MAG: hypothetical protein HYW10_01755, partial [Candidatus Omnitrophica bacterium]|nr:hypothetical protein [Candidatus Omnitrophota bacterium]
GEGTVFDAQGDLLAASRVGNPFRFTGRELDAETRLYYYRTRYYAQTTGRFLSPDPFPASPTNPQSLHRYSYVENNPINLSFDWTERDDFQIVEVCVKDEQSK